MIDPAAYTFDLPPELVAQEPAGERDASHLLRVERGGEVRGLHVFRDLPDLLRPGDLLILNDSRVLPARLWTRRADTGGRVELLLLAPEVPAAGSRTAPWRALARPSRRLRPGQPLRLEPPAAAAGDAAGPTLALTAVHGAGEVTVTAPDGDDLTDLAEQHGDVPLPPYIRRDRQDPRAAERRAGDRRRYQTVYARADARAGASVAAPTAGLHFTDAVLRRLAAREVATARLTLHVGPGTFRPPSAEQIAARRLHPERFVLPAATTAALAACRRRGGRVVAVGTTSLRVLETVARLPLPDGAPDGAVVPWEGDGQEPAPVFTGTARREGGHWAVAGTTRLFLRPPDRITAADGLLTNFHLPGSSLLMLIAAVTGEASWRAAYAEAVARRLRFFSYGDAMLVLPPEAPTP